MIIFFDLTRSWLYFFWVPMYSGACYFQEFLYFSFIWRVFYFHPLFYQLLSLRLNSKLFFHGSFHGTLFTYMLVSQINTKNLQKFNWCHTQQIVQIKIPWIITHFNPWLTSCTDDTSTNKWLWKLQWKSCLLQGTRTGINMESKNWPQGCFRQCNMMAFTLNVGCFCYNLKKKAN